MKKRIVFIIIVLIILFNNECHAEETMSTNKIIESQSSSLNISSFLEETENYKSDVLEGEDISKILSDAISGNIDTSSIGKKILNLFFKEVLTAITSIVSIIIIIIIHSILKNISDGLENSSVSQITYYVTYILIVTIVMKNFADIINMIKGSIESLIGFTNCLLPILMTLMLATRQHKICSCFTTYYIVYNNHNWKYNQRNNNTICTNITIVKYNIKYI